LNEALYSASRISQFDLNNFCIASILDILQTFSRQLELIACMWLLIFLIYSFSAPATSGWSGWERAAIES
jgi:hypothetical protein